MTQQVDMFAPPSELDTAFWQYHQANPGILDRLIQMTEQAKRAGRKHVGIKGMWEVLRWESTLRGQDGYKLNNSYTSRYVRLIAEKRPDLAEMFEQRRIRS